MNNPAHSVWHQANQDYLSTALGLVRGRLARHAALLEEKARVEDAALKNRQALEAAASAMPAPAALDVLCDLFGLSAFERDVLLLCAGMELEADFAGLCAAAQGDPQRAYPTFSLALAALSDPDWDALSPVAPLRFWRLIKVDDGPTLTLSPLHLDERILHYLTGVQYLDERLAGVVEPVFEAGALVSSHRLTAERMAAVWEQTADAGDRPVFQLCGAEVDGKRAIAATACALLGFDLWIMPAQALPAAPSELETLRRLWEREAALGACALLLDCDEVEDKQDPAEKAVNLLIERINSLLIVTSRQRRALPQRPMLTFDVEKPTTAEQRALWHDVLGSRADGFNGQVDRLIFQFNLSAPAIRTACADTLGRLSTRAEQTPASLGDLAATLWQSCRVQARPRLDDLVQRLEPVAGWDDLVLPERQMQILRDMAVQVRRRATVYGRWGFSAKGERGLGIAALFAGASGTGKTLAAEVLAHYLRLDLYRIDLSTVVNKYIGETEKNLRRVFDAAEAGGAILLFDEADALFGKRSEVKDSHDRHANIEVSYLLQRMEAYSGLAVLTTNLKDALDQAFVRRLRFIVPFPFPDAEQRAQIWQCVFPAETPTEGLDARRLAQLNVTGGTIRNIALNAAFLAAEDGLPVAMTHVLRAARSEYGKLEKNLTEAETRGWI